MNTFKKGHIPWNKGKSYPSGLYERTEAHIKQSIANLPKESPRYWLGRTDKVAWNKGKKGCYKASEETKKKMSIAQKNRKCHLYRGGITEIHSRIRNCFEYRQWRAEVFKRDDYICAVCSERGNKLEAHHIKSFSKLLTEFLQVYSQFSPIDDKETLERLSLSYAPFWDLNNGVTLCKNCHRTGAYPESEGA
jgi:5-methylcytosine-specific restriction endonuclease McrA